MKKHVFAGLLAFLLVLAPSRALAAEEAPQFKQSGCVGVEKLSRGEIAALLRENSIQMPEEIFDETPSCEAPYATGSVKPELLERALARLNTLRRVTGLPPVTLNEEWCREAQYAAVVQAANGTLSHYPSQPADMDEEFFRVAKTTSARSNLSAGRTVLSAVDGLMEDSSEGNIPTVGHRRWQLSPALTQVGFGFVNNGKGPYRTFVAEKVFDGPTSAASVDYDFISWPASGYFPNNLIGFIERTPWSVTLNPDKYQLSDEEEMCREITVTLTRQSDGQVWRFSGNEYDPKGRPYFRVDRAGYGVANCIIFAPYSIMRYQGVYTVRIDGLKDKSGAPVTDFIYQVDFFDAGEYTDPGAEEISFPDVRPSDWFSDAVAWAVRGGVTNGTGSGFSPYATCTRAQIITFLYRAMGEPTPTLLTNPFRDVTESDYFYRAAVWAAEMGLATGNAFSGGTPCTRSAVVEYLWILTGRPQAENAAAFPDVPAELPYAQAVSWAVSVGVTQGKSAGFAPHDTCTRGEIVTFLHRYHRLQNSAGE